MASSVVCMPVATSFCSPSPSLSSSHSFLVRGSGFSQPRHLPAGPLRSSRGKCIVAAAASADLDSSLAPAPTSPSSFSHRSQKSKSNSKKQQVMLRFVWMEKNIGIGLDHVVPGQGTVPLTSYYFWPRKDAWEEIKMKLESKKWISKKQTILLLNQATDVINLWQQNATG